MYELMFPYWGDVAKNQSGTSWENEFAQKISDVDKIVFSRTLDKVEYNTRIVRTDPSAELLKLKQAPGKNISVDTVSMFPQLMQAGLIDEYHLIIHPVIVGEGPCLWEGANLPDKLKLKLVASNTFKSGAVALHYVKGD
jgi:dihydrofolate reductase